MTAREKAILTATLTLLKKELHPKRVILFGSRAKGQAQPGSDFDFAVDAPLPNLNHRRAIREQIDELAGLYKVDLVFLQRVSKSFRKIILNTGQILYER